MNTQDMMDKARAIRLINTKGAQEIAASGKANEVIAVRGYFEAWAVSMQYAEGATVDWGGQPMTCITAHDTGIHPDWTPDSAPALWRPWHATEPEYALPWRQPLGAHDAYMTGEYMLWGAEDAPVQAWQCLFDSVVHTPGDRPDAWLAWGQAEAGPPVDEPEEEQPEDGGGTQEAPAWVQPTGAHDAYAVGAVVSHGGQVWRNTVAGNAFAPEVHGWEVVA